MRLVELEPQFLRFTFKEELVQKVPPEFEISTPDGIQAWRSAGSPYSLVAVVVAVNVKVDNLKDAQGMRIRCPKCDRKHQIVLAFAGRNIPPGLGSRDAQGNATQWQVSGQGVQDLTLSPSVDCTVSDPECWHGHIVNGEVTSV